MQKGIDFQVKTLPESPGVYQYFDKNDEVIYVGKAKNLKKRVNSYFSKVHDSGKTRVLVSKITRLEFIVVETETDALLLENNLIKKYQPRYNILLKDDKSYPLICIKKERFPRVFMTRNLIKDGSQYFGPYASVKTVRTILELIKELYPLRTCNYNLSQEQIDQGKYKVCLEYHIGNCLGPCEGLQSEKDYSDSIAAIKRILNGEFKQVIRAFTEEMKRSAEDLEFEKAQHLKEKIERLESYQAKSTVVNPAIDNIDVFTILDDQDDIFVNFLKIVNGNIIQAYTTEIRRKMEESNVEVLEYVAINLREEFNSNSYQVISNVELNLGERIKCTVPIRGDKKRLIDLSLRNAKFYRQEKFKQVKLTDPERHSKRIMEGIKRDLYLNDLPIHMECFDNSNIQGSNPVAACVVFKHAKPSKKDYRKFHIKTVEGPDDFASMEEVVFRRYKRLLQEGEPLPQLIIIDGGKGQLSSAVKSLEILGLIGKVAIIGIAKRLEEIYFPGDPYPIYLDKNSETLKVIQFMRNEAHRFGITFHRNSRSKSAIQSELDGIKGVGDKTKVTLLKKFKTLKKIKSANEADLVEVVGKSKAKSIINHFKS